MQFFRTLAKKLYRLITNRFFFIGILLLLQVLLFLLGLQYLQTVRFINWGLRLLSLLVMSYLISCADNPTYKIAWIILILLSPIVGTVFYVMFGQRKMPMAVRVYTDRSRKVLAQQLDAHPNDGFARLIAQDPRAKRNAYYLRREALSMVFDHTETAYYPLGDDFFPALLEDLHRAEHFIFMEYFIISDGVMWSAIEEVLKRKASEGVEVRLLFDDFGFAMKFPRTFLREMKEAGIQVQKFNRISPSLNAFMNHRDHRKICVVDGNVGYTGGINLADEYINRKYRFGHWKDTAIRLYGDGVWNLTNLFLQMWEMPRGQWQLDFTKYLPTEHPEAKGFVQAFGDDPMDHRRVGEIVYQNLIQAAQKTLYITTPYLILDDTMATSLCSAAQSGVDVHIITPKIPDKWYVHAVTRANYTRLVEAGVRVFEYTPGFIHAKSIVVDGQYAMVGTINFDFRSFYLHYECGAVLYHTDTVLDVQQDFLETERLSEEITPEEIQSIPLMTRLLRSVLSLLSPLI